MASYGMNDVKNGMKIIVDGYPCTIVDTEYVKPGKGQAFTRVKYRNIKTGRVVELTMKSTDSLEPADVLDQDMEYLYSDGEFWHFMHPDTHEQIAADKNAMVDAEKWLKGNEMCIVTLWNGAPLTVSPPNFVELADRRDRSGRERRYRRQRRQASQARDRRHGARAAVRAERRSRSGSIRARANTSVASNKGVRVTATARQVDQVLEARWVIPVEPHGVVLDNHAVALAGDTIVEILPIAAAREKYTNSQRVDLSEHALIPGLVNAHTHNPMVLMRGLADDLPLMTWLHEHIWPAEAKVVGTEFVRDGVELAIAEMLRGGTTCCSENYLFPDAQAATYLKHGFRAVVGLPFIEFPTPWAQSRDEYFDKNLAVHDEFLGETLITTTLAPHAPYTVSNEAFERIRLMSDQLDLPVHIHVHETAQEVDDSKRDHGMRPLARMAALGLVNDHLIAVHMTQLLDSEIAQLAEAGSSVVHCPESNLKLASGFCPAEKLRRAGVNLALGTDGCASNNDLDMFGEMRTRGIAGQGCGAMMRSAFDAAFALAGRDLERGESDRPRRAHRFDRAGQAGRSCRGASRCAGNPAGVSRGLDNWSTRRAGSRSATSGLPACAS